ncbi:MAG TPA: thioredoxin domain-containing protein [Bryobacteraceae bacterium]|nr:thioredoxin domain-containing protein [Bryobacteraceae bacterium]
MKFIFLLCALAGALVAQDWKTATQLPNVDFTGLTPAQKNVALTVMRAEGCVCGCDMKIAECRIADPPCGVSRGLATIILREAKAGKNADAVKEAVENSDIVKKAGQPPPTLEDPVKISIAGAPSKGPSNARVTLVEFSDFECPYCSKAIHEIDAILKAYPKDVRLVYKEYPLDMHPHARLAAQAALAANAQGKFWEMHDKLFANFRNLSRANMIEWAKEIGLDTARFTADLDSGKYKAAVQKDVSEGDSLGIAGTPTIFVNGRRYNGRIALASMKPILEQQLQAKR